MDTLTRTEVLYVYTDGSSLPKPRRGGIGVTYVWLNDAEEEESEALSLDGFEGATNNQMELKACIEGLRQVDLRLLPRHTRIEVRTDSQYVTKHIDLVPTWGANGWCNAEGRPIENAELWKELLKQRFRVSRRVDFKWVKGHAKDRYNKAVDKLAKTSAKGLLNKALRVGEVRRKSVNGSTRVGSVGNKGQRLVIRIVEQQYLPLQKKMRYRYEVISEHSEYAQSVDFFYSSDWSMRAGHTYQVVMGRSTSNPVVTRVLREIIAE